MRIAIALPAPSVKPIGGYRVVYEYANELAALGHDVTVVHGGRYRGGSWGMRSRPRMALTPVYTAISRRRPRWFTIHPGVTVRNLPLVSARSLPDADVLVATSVRTANTVASAARLHGARGVYFIQGHETWDAPRETLDATWRLPLVRIVIAPWLAAIGDQLGVSTHVVQNATDLERFQPGPPIGARPLRVTALVSPQPQKRTDLVGEVLARVHDHLPELTATTFGTCARPDALPAFVTHVRRPAPEALVRLYQEARLYLCTSDSEGWHLPAAEAMACGAAVVSTDNGGVTAYAHDVALFAAPGDVDALTDNVLRLLTDPGLNASLASKGLGRIRARTPRTAAVEFLEVALSGNVDGT